MKNLILVAFVLISVQSVSSAPVKTSQDGVTAEISRGNSMEDNGCMIKNMNNYPVDVTYSITFVKTSLDGKTEEEVSKSATVNLLPVGTQIANGKKSDKFWVTAKAGDPVNFSKTTISITVTRAQEVSDAGRVIKHREKQIPDPYGKLSGNQTTSGATSPTPAVWNRIIVIKVELIEKGTGERYVMKTVEGYLSSDTGSKLNTFNDNDLLFYQKMYGGKFPEYTYDD